LQADVQNVIVASSTPTSGQLMMKSFVSGPYRVEAVHGGAAALEKLSIGKYHLLVLDQWLPDLDVQDVFQMVRARFPEVAVAFHNETESGLPRESTAAKSTQIPALPGMVGQSETMSQVYRNVRLVAKRKTTALIEGESGTGKELIARAIHYLSPRAEKPFVVVNCAAIPESLLESELFGYVRGAFTGANQPSLGRIHAAHGGTLFLDEIGELPLSMQAKFLRFLQEGEVQRLGSPDVFRLDVRVVAATNANLQHKVAEKQFREDLYYRLAIFPVELPALRDRRGDVALLAREFVSRLSREAQCAHKQLTVEAVRVLESCRWPGNVRELQHAVERAFILAEDEPTLTPEHFSFLPKLLN
jgi:transcriptional regulator with GAF, ATPase, and Fis domain